MRIRSGNQSFVTVTVYLPSRANPLLSAMPPQQMQPPPQETMQKRGKTEEKLQKESTKRGASKVGGTWWQVW